MTIRFEDKDPGDTVVVEFDFSPDTSTVTEDPAPTVAVTVAAGTDASPSAILLGPVTVAGGRVYQRVTAGLTGVDYALKCTAASGQDRYTVEAILPVRARPALVLAAAVYCSEAEFEQRFGPRELTDLLSGGTSYARAENDAASTIDGFLAGRYTTPLASPPAIVIGWAADLARYRLWDDHAPEEIRRRAEAALAQLRDVARGVISLPPSATGTAPTVAGFEFEAFGNPRVFDAAGLAGF